MQHFFKTNVPMAIATSSSADSWGLKTVKHVDFFNKYFSHVVTAASDVEVKQGKPAPDVFWVCAKRFPDSPSPSKVNFFLHHLLSPTHYILNELHNQLPTPMHQI